VALNLLVGLIKEFPFVDDASKAVALSGILTSVARRALDFAFMHAVTAPAFGSGKSYLVDLFCMIATGRPAPAVDQSRNQEEFEMDSMLTF
jgi:putative DNA primase/helicase